MEAKIFDDFKMRLMNGDINADTILNITLVNSHFPKLLDYSGLDITQYRNLEDIDNVLSVKLSACDLTYSDLIQDSATSLSLYRDYIDEYNFLYPSGTYNDETPKQMESAEYIKYYTHSALNEISSWKTNTTLNTITYFRTDDSGTSIPLYVYSANSASVLSKYYEELSGNTHSAAYINNSGGFYLLRTLDEMQWFRDKVNATSDYNNKIIGVLTQSPGNDISDIGIGTLTNHFEGVLDGNNVVLSNVTAQTKSDLFGIVNVLGISGIVRDFNISGLEFQNSYRINIDHLINKSTDCYHGGLVGINYGLIENVKYIGEFKPNGYVPSVYVLNNKTEDNDVYKIWDLNSANKYQSNLDIPGYSNGYCINDMSNLIPYAGYFAEYAYLWPIKIQTGKNISSSKITDITTNSSFDITGENATILNNLINYNCQLNNYGYNIEDYLSQKSARIAADNLNGNPVFNYEKGNYPTKWHADEAAEPDGGNGSAKMIKNGLYNKKMHSYLRNAFYISPICGLNNGYIVDVTGNLNIIQADDTFVGFIGGIAGKNAYGMVSGATIVADYNKNSAHSDSYKEYKLESIYNPDDYNVDDNQTESKVMSYLTAINPLHKLKHDLIFDIFSADNDYSGYVKDYTNSNDQNNLVIQKLSMMENTALFIDVSGLSCVFDLGLHNLNSAYGNSYYYPFCYYDSDYVKINCSLPDNTDSSDTAIFTLNAQDSLMFSDYATSSITFNFSNINLGSVNGIYYSPCIKNDSGITAIKYMICRYNDISKLGKSSANIADATDITIIDQNDNTVTFTSTNLMINSEYVVSDSLKDITQFNTLVLGNLSSTSEIMNSYQSKISLFYDNGLKLNNVENKDVIDQAAKSVVYYKMPSIYNIGGVAGQFNILPKAYSQLVNVSVYDKINVTNFTKTQTIPDNIDDSYYNLMNRVGGIAAICDVRGSDVSLFENSARTPVYSYFSKVNVYLIDQIKDEKCALTAAIFPEIKYSPYSMPGVIAYHRWNTDTDPLYLITCNEDIPTVPLSFIAWGDIDKFGGERLTTDTLVPTDTGLLWENSNWNVYSNTDTNAILYYKIASDITDSDYFDDKRYNISDDNYKLTYYGHFQSNIQGLGNLGLSSDLGLSSLHTTSNLIGRDVSSYIRKSDINVPNITLTGTKTSISQNYSYEIGDILDTFNSISAILKYDSNVHGFRYFDENIKNTGYYSKNGYLVTNNTFAIGTDPAVNSIKTYLKKAISPSSINYTIPIFDDLYGVLFADNSGNNIMFVDLQNNYTDYTGNLIINFGNSGVMIQL
jgi:filamentous hemagglutinin family protein